MYLCPSNIVLNTQLWRYLNCADTCVLAGVLQVPEVGCITPVVQQDLSLGFAVVEVGEISATSDLHRVLLCTVMCFFHLLRLFHTSPFGEDNLFTCEHFCCGSKAESLLLCLRIQ